MIQHKTDSLECVPDSLWQDESETRLKWFFAMSQANAGPTHTVQTDEQQSAPFPDRSRSSVPVCCCDTRSEAGWGEGYIWTPGYWAYGDYGFFWVPGTWVLVPEPGLLWTPGYWGWADDIFIFHEGYWGPYVGFYGGINYGFGYVGVGYQGGYWNRGVFFY